MPRSPAALDDLQIEIASSSHESNVSLAASNRDIGNNHTPSVRATMEAPSDPPGYVGTWRLVHCDLAEALRSAVVSMSRGKGSIVKP